jgi:hypothetical protein
MKKIYIKPLLERCVSLLPENYLMVASGVTGNNGIEWGGYDDEGDIIPSAKSSTFEEWDSWEENEESTPKI